MHVNWCNDVEVVIPKFSSFVAISARMKATCSRPGHGSVCKCNDLVKRLLDLESADDLDSVPGDTPYPISIKPPPLSWTTVGDIHAAGRTHISFRQRREAPAIS